MCPVRGSNPQQTQRCDDRVIKKPLATGAAKHYQHEDGSSRNSLTNSCAQKATLLRKVSINFQIFVILVSLGLMGYMTWTTTKLDRGFDVNRSLPEGSSSHKFVTLNEKYFPNNGFPLAVYCGKHLFLDFFFFFFFFFCLFVCLIVWKKK